MKISLNILRELVGMELPPVDELVECINRQLGKVETVVHLGEKYKGVIIVKVVECDKLEQSDHLYKCLIDDDGANKSVERNEQGLVQVLTGAKNVYTGMIAIWLPPNSTVPESFGKEPFVLTSRKMLGVISHGMLASYKELAIGDEHAGIIEITMDDMLPQVADQDRTLAQLVGQSFAETFGLDDTVIDVENKMFTHRPDLFGQLGIAREISAIIRGVPESGESDEDTRFVNPEWYWKLPKFESKEGLDLDTFNDTPDEVSRLIFTSMKDVEVKPSPLWLRCVLVAMGAKPINNIVDVTNYIMLITAQPVHAYDYDKLRGHKIGARMAKYGEKIALLNGKTYELTSDDIVIADGEGPVGLGGIMGGSDSEVDENTKNIVCEVATFNMYTVRKSSMRHGLFTDALTRFNKGQSPLQNSRIMYKLLETLRAVTPGEQAGDVFDVHNDVTKLDETTLSGEIEVSSEFINARLGLMLTTDQIGGLLRRVNFASYPGGKGDDVPVFVAPFWRTDIEQSEDIVEEIGRLYGFEKLPRELPKRSIRPVSNNPMVAVRQLVRESLARFGANEVLTYSFVHKNIIERAGQLVDDAYQLTNALSPELQYYRLSVLPSLLDKVHPNIKLGFDEFTLFEIGKYHDKKRLEIDDGAPSEGRSVDMVYSAKVEQVGAAFYHLRYTVSQLLREFGAEMIIVPFEEAAIDLTDPRFVPFEPKRSGAVCDATTSQVIGVVGELRRSVVKSFKLPDYTAAATLDLAKLVEYANHERRKYRALSRYPSVERAVTLSLASDVSFQTILDCLVEAFDGASIKVSITPKDSYQPKDSETKNVTFQIKFTSYEETLVSDVVNGLMEAALSRVTNELGAHVV